MMLPHSVKSNKDGKSSRYDIYQLKQLTSTEARRGMNFLVWERKDEKSPLGAAQIGLLRSLIGYNLQNGGLSVVFIFNLVTLTGS